MLGPGETGNVFVRFTPWAPGVSRGYLHLHACAIHAVDGRPVCVNPDGTVATDASAAGAASGIRPLTTAKTVALRGAGELPGIVLEPAVLSLQSYVGGGGALSSRHNSGGKVADGGR